MSQEGRKRRAIAAAICIAVLGLAAFWFLYRQSTDTSLAVLDVGQGDAILITTPNKKNILIDGGPDTTVLRRLGEELPFWERRIDIVILTHPHADHYAGLTEVVKRFSIGRIIMSNAESHSAGYQHFLETVRTRHIPQHNLINPQQITIDGLTISFLYPLKSYQGLDIKNFNNTSVVAKVSVGKVDVLLTGDAEIEEERDLVVLYGNNLSAEILKLGHHGSETSSSSSFIEAVQPVIAIASVGADNTYGHPSPSVWQRLEKGGIHLFRTDKDGTVRFKTDGERLWGQGTCFIGCSSL